MKRKKKMIAMLSALAVLLVSYGLIGLIDFEGAQVSENEGSFPLWDESAQIASIAWEIDGTAYAFTKGESVWMKDDDNAFPVNQTAIDNMAGKIAGLVAVRELTDIGTLADYGLDEPAFIVTAKDADGNELVYSLGDATPFEDGYYMSASNSDAVYVVESDWSSAFDKTLTELAAMEALPETTTVTRMTVGTVLDLAYDEEVDAWSDAAMGEVLDKEEVEELVAKATGLEWSELIATSATDEELIQWQLDDEQAVTLALYNGETTELILLLGGTDAEGDRYARLPNSRMVYTFTEGADELLAASIDDLWVKTPVTMETDTITEASFAWEGGEVMLTAAEDGESTTLESILRQVAALEGTERVELGELGETVLTAYLADASGNTQAIMIYAYSVDSYLIPMTDAHGMLVDAEDVDKLIRMLKQAG